MKEKSITPEGIISQAMGLEKSFSGAEFPVEIFPSKIQRIIHEVHECQSYPIGYTAASIFTAIAVGIGNTHHIQMKHGWVESAILFVALVGRPGANKSHPLSFAMKPFVDFDHRHNQELGKLYAKYEQDVSLTKKERIDAGVEEFPQEPIRKRFLVSDITPEGLSYIHAQNWRGLCLCSDELRHGSRTSIAIIMARKSNFGCRYSVPKPLFLTERVLKVLFLSLDHLLR